jgi:hypothetical protein
MDTWNTFPNMATARVDHGPQSSVMTKNVQHYLQSPTCLHGVLLIQAQGPLQVPLFRTLIKTIISVTGTLCTLYQKHFQNKTLRKCMLLFLTRDLQMSYHGQWNFFDAVTHM